MKTLKWLFVVLLITSSVGCLGMLVPEETKMAAEGRYLEMGKYLEVEGKDQSSLKTQKLYYLCTSYARLKEYNKLFPCLEQLESNIAKGDNIVDMLIEVSATPSILRAEVYIDFGNYPAAVEQATKAVTMMQELDLKDRHEFYRRTQLVQALSALALSQALMGERAKAEENVRLVGEVSHFMNVPLKTIKLNGQARVYMALGDFSKSLATIKEDEGDAWFRAYQRIAF